MHMDGEYLTKEKFDELSKELEYLKTEKRKEIAEALEYAKSLGDLSENQEYHEARDAQAVVEDRIKRLEAMLKSANIVSTRESGAVAVGSVISVEKESDPTGKTSNGAGGTKRIYTIVGSEEADAAAGKISMRSPLGQAALGKKKGETFSFQAPGGTAVFKIVDIK